MPPSPTPSTGTIVGIVFGAVLGGALALLLLWALWNLLRLKILQMAGPGGDDASEGSGYYDEEKGGRYENGAWVVNG